MPNDSDHKWCGLEQKQILPGNEKNYVLDNPRKPKRDQKMERM